MGNGNEETGNRKPHIEARKPYIEIRNSNYEIINKSKLPKFKITRRPILPLSGTVTFLIFVNSVINY